MTSGVEEPDDEAVDQPADEKPDVAEPSPGFGSDLLAVAGLASIGAGAIHATAAGLHNEHRQALWAFIGAAVFQIGWGALTMLRSRRWFVPVALLGAAGNTAALGAWILAKTNGISFIDGLEQSEKVQAADGIAASLAAIAALVAVAALVQRVDVRSRFGPRLVGAAAVAAMAVTLPGMVSAGEHQHSEGEAAAHSHGDEAVATGAAAADPGHSHEAQAVAPVPYDPTQPIDLGGVEGVTPEQQARAENLIALTLARLPQFADISTLEARGYFSIGDSITGEEHYINWSLIDDDHILDPDYPESLVYKVNPDRTRTLEAAMFMLPNGTTLDDVPDVGGNLTQFHIHDNLCFSDDPVAPKVADVISIGGECRPPFTKPAVVPMLHVWIKPHRCGPFAALEGVGAGQIKEGEERLCDTAHGSH
ncbi:MAG TPA: hypothetical protein VGJ86_13440 [Acidimicrobiales bacterium]